MSVNLQSLYKRRLTVPGQRDAIREPLYDFLTYDSGATLNLRFFQDPIGGTKTKADTNMTLAGQLPKGWKYIVETMEIVVMPGSNAANYVRQSPVQQAAAAAAPNFANDVWALLSVGYAEITVGSKPYLTAPLLSFPSTTGLMISAAAATEDTGAAIHHQITADYARLVGKAFLFNPVMPLEENTNFDVTLNWPAAVVLPSAFDARIGIVFNGIKFRT